MKLFLTYHSELEPDGYLIITPVYINGKKRINAELWGLDDIVQDESCDHILSIGSLEYMGVRTIQALQCWAKKLKPGAEMSIVVNNVYELARRYSLGEIDLSVFNSNVFERGKASSFDIFTIKEVIKQAGLKLINLKPSGTLLEVTVSR